MQASNRCNPQSLRASVVSVAEKPGLDFRRYDLERRAQRTVDKCRNSLTNVKTGKGHFLWVISYGMTLKPAQAAFDI